MNQSLTDFASKIFEEKYRFLPAQSRRITQPELTSHLESILGFSPEVAGFSMEGRPVHRLTWGDGPIRILMWSQMHGNEPTATLALLDLWSLLHQYPDLPVIQSLRSSVTIRCIPMLNPDGAQRFQRRNAAGIDLNRDAGALASSEARILKSEKDQFDPHWGFNLHDQNPRYTVGNTGKVARISLLAPAFNLNRDNNEVRDRAKCLISRLAKELDRVAGPNHTGKYDDAFGSRCFGDNMQKWGVSTILIESGGDENPDKPFVRQLNLHLFLCSLVDIASGNWKNGSPEGYEAIPFNGPLLADLKLTDLMVQSAGSQTFKADLAINMVPMEQINGHERLVGLVADIGALHPLSAKVVVKGTPGVLRPGTSVQLTGDESAEILKNHLMNGASTFYYPEQAFDKVAGWVSVVPGTFCPVGSRHDHSTRFLNPGERASFRIVEGDRPVQIVVNGLIVWTAEAGWEPVQGWWLPDGVKGLEVEL
ncbi:MAG: peptidase M14 [Bacteroidetes bacterium]|nr:peptidase M14 [Bacteroidota bacterium]